MVGRLLMIGCESVDVGGNLRTRNWSLGVVRRGWRGVGC